MAMDIDPTPALAVVTTEQPFEANALWGDRLNIDASSRDYGKIGAMVQATEYLKDGQGNAVAFAKDSDALKTENLVAALQRIPEMAIAFGAVEVGIVAWKKYRRARATDLAAANERLKSAKAAQADAEAAAQATVEQAKAAADKALADRTAVYKTRTDSSDPAWLAADQAWQQATEAHAKAAAAAANDPAVLAAKEATRAAEDDAKVAQAAFDDPANPPLQA